jgi:WD40 repeat protein
MFCFVSQCTMHINAHDAPINAVNFGLFPNRVATGAAGGEVCIWDSRMVRERRPLFKFNVHSGDVYHLRWSQMDADTLASGGSDRRVCIYDIDRSDVSLDADDAKEGPPELLFVHGGHTSSISDISWHPTDKWVVASVSDDNVVQVWKINPAIAQNRTSAQAPVVPQAPNKSLGQSRKRRKNISNGDKLSTGTNSANEQASKRRKRQK